MRKSTFFKKNMLMLKWSYFAFFSDLKKKIRKLNKNFAQFEPNLKLILIIFYYFRVQKEVANNFVRHRRSRSRNK